MIETVAFSLGSILLVSLVSLVGVFTIAVSDLLLRRISLFLVSFAVGGLFGDAFLHILPEAYGAGDDGPTVPLLVVAGILFFFVIEKFLRWRHCHAGYEHDHVHPVVAMNLIGDGVHNLVDGAVIAASYLVSVPIGVTTTLAILLHEIPQEMSDFAVLVHGGLSRARALLFNFVSAAIAFAGAALVLLIGPHFADQVHLVLPITAGGFIYIAGSDLIPELHHDTAPRTSLVQLAAIVAGVAVMALLLLLE